MSRAARVLLEGFALANPAMTRSGVLLHAAEENEALLILIRYRHEHASRSISCRG